MDLELLRLRYDQLLTLWNSFCEHHTKLYELTCDEYQYLLKSDIEGIEQVLEKKEIMISAIRDLEKVRSELIADINKEDLLPEEITSLSSLIIQMQVYEESLNLNGLRRYNQLLISIIENIQKQNKCNQVFLNKAISSIEDMKAGFTQNKSYQTYDKKGMAKKNQIAAR